MRGKGTLTVILPVCALVVLAGTTFGAWNQDPSVNVVVSNGALKQMVPKAISDGAGGAYVIWHDTRGSVDRLYAGHLLASGAQDISGNWYLDGISISTTDLMGSYVILSDGGSGSIVIWCVAPGNIAAHHLLSDGSIDTTGGWSTGGVAVCNALNLQDNMDAIPDGSGGAYIVWEDNRGSDTDIYIHHLLSSGYMDSTGSWTADGVAVCTYTRDQVDPRIALGDLNGIFVAWTDYRSAAEANRPDVYVQRVSEDGQVGGSGWAVNGVGVTTDEANEQTLAAIIADDDNGAYIIWEDKRNHLPPTQLYFTDIYASRIKSNGSFYNTGSWTENGTGLVVGTPDSYSPVAIPDDNNNVIIAYISTIGIDTYHLYAVKLLPDGSLDDSESWLPGGVLLSTSEAQKDNPVIISDGENGAIVAWEDYRNGADPDVYAQRITSQGVAGGWSWWLAGKAMSTANGSQSNISAVTDGDSGVIVIFQDDRNGKGSFDDIYAQKANQVGWLDPNLPSMSTWAVIFCILLISLLFTLSYRSRQKA